MNVISNYIEKIRNLDSKEKMTLIGYVIGFVTIHITIVAINTFGLNQVVSDYSLLIKSIPYGFRLNGDLFLTIVIALMIFAFMQTQKLNNKTFKNGVEHGSARWGTINEIKPYIETTTYWFRGRVIDKKKYDRLIADNYTEARIEYRKVIQKYKKANVKNPYSGFNEFIKTNLRIEKNSTGTTNNLLLSASEKLSYSGRQSNGKPGRNTNGCVVGGSG